MNPLKKMKLQNRCLAEMVVGRVGPYPVHLGIMVFKYAIATRSVSGTRLFIP